MSQFVKITIEFHGKNINTFYRFENRFLEEFGILKNKLIKLIEVL